MRLGIALGLALAALLASPLVLRELGPTTTVRISDGDRFLDVRVWYVGREGVTWIRCGDASRDWCQKLAATHFASVGIGGGIWRGVDVEAVADEDAPERFQEWLEEDHPRLGWLPKLRGLENARVFRLSSLGRHTPAKPEHRL